MTVTILFILSVLALIATVVSMMGHCPVTVPVLLLCIVALLQSSPWGIK